MDYWYKCFVADNVALSGSKPFLLGLTYSDKVEVGELSSPKFWGCYQRFIASEHLLL